MLPSNILICSSKMALLGKTAYILDRAAEQGRTVLTLSIAGELNPENFLDRIRKLHSEISSLKTEIPIRLHIKLDITFGTPEHTACLDQILYQLIFSKCIAMGNGFLFLNRFEGIDIEISNSIKHQFLEVQELSCLKLLLANKGQTNLNIVLLNIEQISRASIKIDKLRPFGFEKVGTILLMLKSDGS